MNLFQDKNILLGVSGSIAAYKAVDLASKLAQAGARVQVILTQSAVQFVSPLTFQSVTAQRAFVDADLWGRAGHIRHIGLARAAQLLVIAPATANTIAKLAHGLADNLLSITTLAAECPLLVAPAMDGGMYAHPSTQENLARLRRRGVTIIGPAEGHLASGLTGLGRMVEPQEILGHIRLALAAGGPLQGRRILVSAGGTQEPIDPVRLITNRSSGKQGYALAQAALDLGAAVTLVSTPVCLETPAGAQRILVSTAQEMLEAILEEIPRADALIMAAAVADFRPASIAADKLKKKEGLPEITLEPVPDILDEVAARKEPDGRPYVIAGFAAESQNLLANARAKLEAKKLDLIVANDITAADAGFGVDTNRVSLISKDGKIDSLPLMSKIQVASTIMEKIVELLPDFSGQGAHG